MTDQPLSAFESRIPDHWRQWIRDYKMRRNERDKQDKLILHLSAYDFPGDDVEIKFEDGSNMKINFAFYTQVEQEIAVFSEHLGYFFFHSSQIIKIKGLKKQIDDEQIDDE